MSHRNLRPFVHTRAPKGPDVARLVWMLITGLALTGSSLLVLFTQH